MSDRQMLMLWQRIHGLYRLEVKTLAVSNDFYYKPDEALHELQMHETIMKALVDVQTSSR